MKLDLGTYKAADILTPKRNKIGRFDSFKAKVYRATHFTMKWSAILAALILTVLGTQLYDEYVAINTVSVAWADTKAVDAPIAILDRIAQCESKGHQLNPNGQVLLNVNTNGTVDIGKYQINSIHEAEATKLGFDLFTESGNTAYAKYLFLNRGSGDWSSSAACWRR